MANCSRRMDVPSCEATILVILPALLFWQSTQLFGCPRFTLLNRLNASARSCSDTPSFTKNFFATERSVFTNPGPYSESRAMLPKVPAAGRTYGPKEMGFDPCPSTYGEGVKYCTVPLCG